MDDEIDEFAIKVEKALQEQNETLKEFEKFQPNPMYRRMEEAEPPSVEELFS